MKKDKEKSLVKKARKTIRKSIEEQLTAEIIKSVTSQGKDPKKVKKEIKQAVSLIANKLAKKEGISKAEPTEVKPAEVETPKENVNSFEVAPAVEKKAPVARKTRTPSKNKVATPEASAPPVIRKRAPRKVIAKTTEPDIELSTVTETENS